MTVCYTVPEIQRVTDVIFIFHSRLFFALLPPNNKKNQNLRLEISSFYTFNKNYDHMMYGSWDMVRDGWADGWTDGKSDRWVSHLKKNKGHKRIFFDAIGKKRKQNWKGKGRVSLLKINSGKMIKQKTFSWPTSLVMRGPGSLNTVVRVRITKNRKHFDKD